MSALGHPKIGILGGTFNPIHLGHLLIAQDALELGKLDRVKFIPVAKPPLKPSKNLASPSHRLNMVALAISGNDQFEVDDLEIRHGGKSYSVETLARLKRQEPDADFYWILGADSYGELSLWHKVERLAPMCHFLVLARPGRRARTTALPSALAKIISAKWITGHVCDLSSTEIRRRVLGGKSIHYLTPPAVRAYILKHRLYV